MLEVAGEDVALYGPVREQAEAALRALPGVARVHVALTAGEPPPSPGATRVRRTVGRLPAETQARAAPPAPAPGAARPAHVRRVVAVASGKGGVGKSTVAANLACAFAALGRRTGLLDADVYGPSAPKMMGLSGEPSVGPDNKLQPVFAYGVACASIGLLVDEGAPMIWRGPMASSAVGQLLNDVAWGTEAEPLDVLVIDMPPGTGDVQLTLAQRTLIDGAVIVSTPQEVALIDVRRGAEMFRKTATPILGVVENMAFFLDADGRAVEIFGRGGARRTAADLGAPFLGEVPISIALREGGDAGRRSSRTVRTTPPRWPCSPPPPGCWRRWSRARGSGRRPPSSGTRVGRQADQPPNRMSPAPPAAPTVAPVTPTSLSRPSAAAVGPMFTAASAFWWKT